MTIKRASGPAEFQHIICVRRGGRSGTWNRLSECAIRRSAISRLVLYCYLQCSVHVYFSNLWVCLPREGCLDKGKVSKIFAKRDLSAIGHDAAWGAPCRVGSVQEDSSRLCPAFIARRKLALSSAGSRPTSGTLDIAYENVKRRRLVVRRLPMWTSLGPAWGGRAEAEGVPPLPPLTSNIYPKHDRSVASVSLDLPVLLPSKESRCSQKIDGGQGEMISLQVAAVHTRPGKKRSLVRWRCKRRS